MYFASGNFDDIIREGGGHADLLRDLVDLADLGEEHPKPLTTIGFNLESLQKARTISHEILVLLPASNGAKDEKNQAKLLHDKAYTLLYNKVRERREYGQYIL
jgi:hypothetical protein